MAQRDQWKMLHLLNTSPTGSISRQALGEMGINCHFDTIQILEMAGLVMREADDTYHLTPPATAMMNNFMVADGITGMNELYIDVSSCFVVMPFGQPWSDKVYKDYIQAALNDAAIKCVRGDAIPRVGKLAGNVIKEIQKAGLIIVDITAPNPNVYYELGVADTIGKDVFLLFEKDSLQQLPADIQGAHYYAYNINDLETSRKELTAALNDWKQQHCVEATTKHYS